MSDNKRYPDYDEFDVARYDWLGQARCKGMDDEVVEKLFYPVGNSDPYKPERRIFCAGCPVAAECLAYGNIVSPEDGAFGGFNAKERRAQRRYGRLGKAYSLAQLMAE